MALLRRFALGQEDSGHWVLIGARSLGKASVVSGFGVFGFKLRVCVCWGGPPWTPNTLVPCTPPPLQLNDTAAIAIATALSQEIFPKVEGEFDGFQGGFGISAIDRRCGPGELDVNSGRFSSSQAGGYEYTAPRTINTFRV